MSETDWGAIRREYETDGTSARKLAEKYGVSHTAINKRVKEEGWIKGKKAVSTKKVSIEKVSTKKVERKKVETRKVESGKLLKTGDVRESLSGQKKQSREKNDLGFEPDDFGLSEQQALFVFWYVKTKNRAEAYKKAGYICEGTNVYPAASQVYRNIKVSKAIRFLEKRIRERYTADLDEIVDQLVAITRADPNQISQYRLINCRYCWGEDHHYQYRDEDEYDRVEKKASKDGKSPPEYGGVGFIDNMDPNPDCPRCNGEGVGELKLGDTRDLDGDERAYFLGVKQTKNGLEVITESKQAARTLLVKIIGDRKDEDAGNVMNVMPMPTANNVDEWEGIAQPQQDESLGT